MDNTTVHRLGEYIREVDIRNHDLQCQNLLGLSISKEFIPSIANIIGTDLRSYKVVENDQFAYVPVTSRNGEKITVAHYREKGKCIISQAYTVFEIIKKEELLPDYLMLWFRRPEFDRYARFKSHGSAREVFGWDEFCNTVVPIPSIDEQSKIVNQYNTIRERIEINKHTIFQLEDAAHAIYRMMFIDNIDTENLPAGWRKGTIRDFCKSMTSGGTPSRDNLSYWDAKKKGIPWIKTGEVQNAPIFRAEEYITDNGLIHSSAKVIPAGSVIMAMYGGGTVGQVGFLEIDAATNQACCNMTCDNKDDASFLYYHLRFNQDKIKSLANGGAQENLSISVIGDQPLVIPDITPGCFKTIYEYISVLHKETLILQDTSEILVSQI